MTSVLRKSLSKTLLSIPKMYSTKAYETLSVTVPKEYVYHVKFNRPDKRNALNGPMWEEMKRCFEELSDNEDCRSIILSGEGLMFSAGIDLNYLISTTEEFKSDDVARKAKYLRQRLIFLQSSVSSLEKCKKPVLVAVHNGCIGAGVNIISSGDMRYCTTDAWFQIKEVEIGLAPDIGVLQRFPKIIGNDSLARELCYTAQKFDAKEALQMGLVSRVFNDKNEMIEEVTKIAEDIARKSPVAVQGTKANLIHSRDHSVDEGLEYMATWNQAMLQSEDLPQAAMAMMTKNKDVVFAKL